MLSEARLRRDPKDLQACMTYPAPLRVEHRFSGAHESSEETAFSR